MLLPAPLRGLTALKKAGPEHAPFTVDSAGVRNPAELWSSLDTKKAKEHEKQTQEQQECVIARTRAFIGTTLLWLLLRHAGRLSPIWAITSMIAASDPVIKQAAKTFRGRIINALLGSVVGLFFLVAGGSSEWKLPNALAVTVLLSTYVVRVQVMWRQAPITAAIIIASGPDTPLGADCIGVRYRKGGRSFVRLPGRLWCFLAYVAYLAAAGKRWLLRPTRNA